MRQYSLPFFLLSLLLFSFYGFCVGATGDKPTARSSRAAYLRAGPGPDHSVISVVKAGAQLTLEGREGEWYLVTALNGQRGYVYKKFLQLAAQGQPQAITVAPIEIKPGNDESKGPARIDSLSSPARTASVSSPSFSSVSSVAVESSPAPSIGGTPLPAVTRVAEQVAPPPQSPALIQLLEGREMDVMLWLAIALGFFLVGWICGGNYYLRRDRVRRTKLRF